MLLCLVSPIRIKTCVHLTFCVPSYEHCMGCGAALGTENLAWNLGQVELEFLYYRLAPTQSLMGKLLAHSQSISHTKKDSACRLTLTICCEIDR